MITNAPYKINIALNHYDLNKMVKIHENTRKKSSYGYTKLPNERKIKNKNNKQLKGGKGKKC